MRLALALLSLSACAPTLEPDCVSERWGFQLWGSADCRALDASVAAFQADPDADYVNLSNYNIRTGEAAAHWLVRQDAEDTWCDLNTIALRDGWRGLWHALEHVSDFCVGGHQDWRARQCLTLARNHEPCPDDAT